MHTILVADDSVTIQRAVEIVFDKEPFTVIKAGSGQEALARARASQPHVVLVDHTMPDQSGYDLAAALKADPSTQAIPVLFFSATANPYDENRGRAAGITGFVQKPFDCQTLLDRVRGLLGVAATAPGSFSGATSTAPTSAAAAALPRPPSLGGIPRPPSIGGIPRPGSGIGTPNSPTTANPIAVPATTSSAGKPLDPFGFSTALSSPPQPAAASSTPPAPVAPRAPTPAPQPLSSPSAVAQAPAQSGWQAMAPGKGLGGPFSATAAQPAPEAPKAATPSWMPSTPPAAAPPKPAPAPMKASDDLMEISDIDVVSDPQPDPAKATAKLNYSDVEKAASAPASVPTPAAQPASAVVSRAVDAVVAAAAPAVQAVNGAAGHGAVSKETLSAEARAIIEKIAWEVVPELAEVIIKEEIQRILKAKSA